MDKSYLKDGLSNLSTPLVADALCATRACLFAWPLKAFTPSCREAMSPAARAGRCNTTAACISFLEAMENAEEGDILVIDNEGRMDEACIGDLTRAGGSIERIGRHSGLGLPPRHSRACSDSLPGLQLREMPSRADTVGWPRSGTLSAWPALAI